MARVSLPPAFQKWTKGQSQVEVSAEHIEQLIIKLEASFPDLKEKIQTREKNLQRFIKIFVNGDDIKQLDGLGTVLKPNDKVKILLALAGG